MEKGSRTVFSPHQTRFPAGLVHKPGIGLHQAGVASEPPDSFRETYLPAVAVAQETNSDVLFVLAQWVSGEEASAAFHREWRQGWQRRLVNEYENTRRVAELSLLRQALEQGDGEALRRVTWKV